MSLPSGLSWPLHPLEGLESISERSQEGTSERVGKAEGDVCFLGFY